MLVMEREIWKASVVFAWLCPCRALTLHTAQVAALCSWNLQQLSSVPARSFANRAISNPPCLPSQFVVLKFLSFEIPSAIVPLAALGPRPSYPSYLNFHFCIYKIEQSSLSHSLLQIMSKLFSIVNTSKCLALVVVAQCLFEMGPDKKKPLKNSNNNKNPM